MPDGAAGPAPRRVIAPSASLIAEVGGRILRDDPRPGATPPTESDLTGELGISRRSARRALGALSAAGLLASADSPGGPALSGTEVGGIERLLRLLLMHGTAFDDTDVLGVRAAVERAAAARAATVATGPDLADLRLIVDEMRDPGIAPADFASCDTAFHLRVARVAGGGLEEHLLHGLSDAVAGRMRAVFAADPDWRATAGLLADEHAHLLVLIAAGHAAAAADAVEDHVVGFYADRLG